MSQNSEPTTESAGGQGLSGDLSPHRPTPGRFRSLLALAVVSLLILLAVAGLKNYRELTAAQERQTLLENRIEQTRERNRVQEVRLRRLESDPAALERLAREDLRMARPGDVIILLPAETAALPAMSRAEPAAGASGDG